MVVGIPSLGRFAAELENLMGTFVNTLPIRTSLPEDGSFAELLSGVRHTLLQAFKHSELPFHKLVEALGVSGSTAHTPVYQAIIALNDADSELADSSLCARTIEPEVGHCVAPSSNQNSIFLLLHETSSVWVMSARDLDILLELDCFGGLGTLFGDVAQGSGHVQIALWMFCN